MLILAEATSCVSAKTPLPGRASGLCCDDFRATSISPRVPSRLGCQGGMRGLILPCCRCLHRNHSPALGQTRGTATSQAPQPPQPLSPPGELGWLLLLGFVGLGTLILAGPRPDPSVLCGVGGFGNLRDLRSG